LTLWKLNFSTPSGLVSDRVHKSGHYGNDIALGEAWEGHLGSLIGRWRLRASPWRADGPGWRAMRPRSSAPLNGARELAGRRKSVLTRPFRRAQFT
jgi:hypothetical protein